MRHRDLIAETNQFLSPFSFSQLEVVGAVVVGLLASYSTYWRSYDTVPILFLLLIATACLITTGCLLISCLLSISTATIIAKTLFVSCRTGSVGGY